MELRTLGRSGLKIFPLVLGTDNFANPTLEDESVRIVHRAIEAGVNLIDTSNSYAGGECERILGRILAEGGRRDRVLVATKVFYPTGPEPDDRGGSRRHIMRACEDSLRRLGTDRIDLYQLHRPDFQVPLEETMEALTDLMRAGKVRFIGSSTFPAWRVMEGLMWSELKGYARFVSEQPPYNLLDRRVENELVPMCRAHGLGLLPWSPLAMGMLAGRYAEGSGFPDDSRASLRGGIYAERVTPRAVAAGNRFARLAAESGLSPARMAVAWVKDRPGVTAPVIGPRTMDQLEDFLAAAEMTLSDDLRAACDAIVPPGSAVADFHNTSGWMLNSTLFLNSTLAAGSY